VALSGVIKGISIRFGQIVEINLFDAVACFNTLFSDISCVKHNIGLTLFGYFKSSFILWHAPRRGNTFAIGMVQHLHDSYPILLSSTFHNGGTRSYQF